MDSESGETYHLEWNPEQRAAHRERIAGFVHGDDGIARIAESTASGPRDRRIGMLLASVRDLETEPPTKFTRMFTQQLWPALPPGWEPNRGRFIEMFQLWVDPGRRRRGIASSLKSQLDQAARDGGVSLLYTHTRATNTHVVTLNEKLGYTAFRTGPLWDDVARVSLAKHLPP